MALRSRVRAEIGRVPLRPPKRMPGVITRAMLVGRHSLPRMAPPRPLPRQPVPSSGVWRWWCASHAARRLLCLPASTETPPEPWPDWVWVGELAEAASRYLDENISKQRVGRFLMDTLPDIERDQRIYERRTGRGTLIRRYHWTMYRVGPFRDRSLTGRPPMW